MARFTDYFLRIPVRVYRTDLEDYEELDEYGIGWAKVHYMDFEGSTWHEGYGKGVVGIGENTTFDLTVIRTIASTYYCTWEMKKFEEKLNEFMKKVDKYLEEDQPEKEEDLEL